MHMGNMTKDFVPVGKDEQAEVKDENGRELPQWLKEAEEKSEAEKVQSF